MIKSPKELDEKYQSIERDQLIALCELAEIDFKKQIDETMEAVKRADEFFEQNLFLKAMLDHIYRHGFQTYEKDFGHTIQDYIKLMDQENQLGILPTVTDH